MYLLSRLPDSTRISTAGLEGIYYLEEGNLNPIKVLRTVFGVSVYIDDGITDHGPLMDSWLPIDEFVSAYCEFEGNAPE